MITLEISSGKTRSRPDFRARLWSASKRCRNAAKKLGNNTRDRRERSMRTHLWKIAGVSLLAIALAAACDNKPAETATPAAETPATLPPPPAPDYAALLKAADRPADDAKDDEARKP